MTIALARDYAKDPAIEFRQLFAMGVDSLVTDFSNTAYKAREAMATGIAPIIEYVRPSTSRYFRTATDTAVRARMLEQGAVECLFKPFSEEALLGALTAAIRVK